MGDGTASWDAATGTLVLENATISYYMEICPEDPTQTVTIVLKGNNTVTHNNMVLYSNANVILTAEEGATLTDQGCALSNVFYAKGDLTVQRGAYILTSTADYPILASDSDVTIKDGANLTLNSQNSSAIYGAGCITVAGATTKVDSQSHYCTMLNGQVVIDGATVTGHTVADHPIYTTIGGISIANGANVELTSDYSDATALFVNGEYTLSITDSQLTASTGSTTLFTKGDVVIDNSIVDISSGANPINAWGDLEVKVTNTQLTTTGTNPVIANTVAISGGTVNVTATSGTAITGNNGVPITSGNVTTSTTAAMSAIYAANGDIVFDDKNTKVTATSALDSAVFTRNGTITLNAGEINATAGENKAAFTARISDQTDTSTAPKALIGIGENFEAKGNMVATTVWKNDGTSSYYADTMLVPIDTALNNDGLLPEDYVPTNNQVNITLKPADYTAVDAAAAKAAALNPSDYVDFSGVVAAVAAVDRTKDITQQAEVDAIENAIAQLQRIPDTKPDNTEDDKVDSPDTGDTSFAPLAVLALAGIGTVLAMRRQTL